METTQERVIFLVEKKTEFHFQFTYTITKNLFIAYRKPYSNTYIIVFLTVCRYVAIEHRMIELYYT